MPGALPPRLVLYSPICIVEVARRWWGYELSGWKNVYTVPASLVWPTKPHAASSIHPTPGPPMVGIDRS